MPSALPAGSDPTLLAARQTAWLNTLPRRAVRPTTYGRLSPSDFRVTPSPEATGGDFGAVNQLRDASGRWVDIVTGSMTGLPPLDGSGRYLAFTVSRITAGQLRPHVWVYVVSVADARVLRRLRLDDSRAVAGRPGRAHP
jgi:hypothetical protein